MIEDDPIQGVSWRNTKRHHRKKTTVVGPDGPRLPGVWAAGLPLDPEAHIHPRRYRTEKCPCMYPCKPCDFMDNDGRNYCFLNEEKVNGKSRS